MRAIMGETRRHCQTCGGAGVATVGDGDYEGAGCHDEDCPECGGNGYVIVVAAVEDDEPETSRP